MAAVAARLRRLVEQCPVLGADAHATASLAALRGPFEYGVFDRVARAVPGPSAGGTGVCAAGQRQTFGGLVEVRFAARARWISARQHRLAARQERFPHTRRQLVAGCSWLCGGAAPARSRAAQPAPVLAAGRG